MANYLAPVRTERDGSGELLGFRFVPQNILNYYLCGQRNRQIVESVKLKFGGGNIESEKGIIDIFGGDQNSLRKRTGRGLRGSAGFYLQQGEGKIGVVLNR